MFGGGGNPRKMKQMMEQMGIDFEELAVEDVTITLEDGSQLHFPDVDVTRMDAQGQQTYQVVGEPEERSAAEGSSDGDDAEDGIPADDIDLVATRTGVPEDEARAALKEVDGDLAAAVERLE
jgi:nascent polypeptide-associated complex subunit alpha